MGLVLAQRVSRHDQLLDSASDFRDEFRELEQGEHRLGGDFTDKVGAAGAVRFDQLKVSVELLLDRAFLHVMIHFSLIWLIYSI